MSRITLASALLSGALAAASTSAEAPVHFAGAQPFDCKHIRLDLAVDLPSKSVKGNARLELETRRETSRLELDAVAFEVSKVRVVTVSGEIVEHELTNDGERLDLSLGRALKPGERITVDVDYSVTDPQSGLHFYAPSRNEPDVPWVVWSQGETIQNRYWFPCFDHPNERQTTELIITTDERFEVSSNGRLVSKESNPDEGTRTWHWSQEGDHVAYLVSLIIGEFHVTTEEWRGKEISYWVHPEYADRVERSFGRTIPMLDFFTELFGMEYPWHRYAQIACEGFGGGMENTSATTLGTRSLHDERSVLDGNSDGLIAHELGHQWWGDLLTCREWAHLWLNEGFATYSEALWNEHDKGDDEFRYNMLRKARSAIKGGKDRPIVDRSYPSPGSMFDSRAYPKGAWVLHMLRRQLGDETFFSALNHYGTEHAYGTVESVDLRKAIEEKTGESYERFFYDWTERPGHPEVVVSYKWLAEDKLARVKLAQKQEAAAFEFPIEFEFHFDQDGDAQAVSIKRQVTEKSATWYVPLPARPMLFRVDPSQAVLMDLKVKQGRTLWKRQLLADEDPIARIRAAAHFGDSKARKDRELLASALDQEDFWGTQIELARALGKTGGSVARDALLRGLTLPDHRARRACVEALGGFHRDEAVIKALRPLVSRGDASYRVEAAAYRSYAQIEADDAGLLLRRALSRDSREDILRQSAIRALGHVLEERSVNTVIAWTKEGKPRRVRQAAVTTLSGMTKRIPMTPPTTTRLVDALRACLGDTGDRLRRNSVNALAGLDEPAVARAALPALRAMALSDGNARVRKGADQAITAIESNKPARVQVEDMRKELHEALEENESLRERLDRLEAAAGRSGTKEAQGADADVGTGQGKRD